MKYNFNLNMFSTKIDDIFKPKKNDYRFKVIEVEKKVSTEFYESIICNNRKHFISAIEYSKGTIFIFRECNFPNYVNVKITHVERFKAYFIYSFKVVSCYGI